MVVMMMMMMMMMVVVVVVVVMMVIMMKMRIAGSVARRPHGRGRPRRGENTMKSEEQSRGQAKGFSQAGGCFRFDFLCARNEFGAPWGARICFYISLQDAFDLSNSFDRSS